MFNCSDPINILSFLLPFQILWDTNCIYKGAGMWHLHLFMRILAGPPSTLPHVCLIQVQPVEKANGNGTVKL